MNYKSTEKRNHSLVSKTESQGEEKNSMENILSQCDKEISLATRLKQPGLTALVRKTTQFEFEKSCFNKEKLIFKLVSKHFSKKCQNGVPEVKIVK